MNLLAMRAGLVRDEHCPEQALGLLAHVLLRFDYLDPAGLAAPAGVDLCLNNNVDIAQLMRDLLRFIECCGDWSANGGSSR